MALSMKDVVEAEESNEYEVEKIMASRMINGVRKYKVRWAGYGPNDDTWQEEDTLLNNVAFLEYKEQQNKKKTDAKKKPKHRGPKGVIFVSSDDEQFDTVKDHFWKDLEEGKLVQRKGDILSGVKVFKRQACPTDLSEEAIAARCASSFSSLPAPHKSQRHGKMKDVLYSESDESIKRRKKKKTCRPERFQRIRDSSSDSDTLPDVSTAAKHNATSTLKSTDASVTLTTENWRKTGIYNSDQKQKKVKSASRSHEHGSEYHSSKKHQKLSKAKCDGTTREESVILSQGPPVLCIEMRPASHEKHLIERKRSHGHHVPKLCKFGDFSTERESISTSKASSNSLAVILEKQQDHLLPCSGVEDKRDGSLNFVYRKAKIDHKESSEGHASVKDSKAESERKHYHKSKERRPSCEKLCAKVSSERGMNEPHKTSRQSESCDKITSEATMHKRFQDSVKMFKKICLPSENSSIVFADQESEKSDASISKKESRHRHRDHLSTGVIEPRSKSTNNMSTKHRAMTAGNSVGSAFRLEGDEITPTHLHKHEAIKSTLSNEAAITPGVGNKPQRQIYKDGNVTDRKRRELRADETIRKEICDIFGDISDIPDSPRKCVNSIDGKKSTNKSLKLVNKPKDVSSVAELRTSQASACSLQCQAVGNMQDNRNNLSTGSRKDRTNNSKNNTNDNGAKDKIDNGGNYPKNYCGRDQNKESRQYARMERVSEKDNRQDAGKVPVKVATLHVENIVGKDIAENVGSGSIKAVSKISEKTVGKNIEKVPSISSRAVVRNSTASTVHEKKIRGVDANVGSSSSPTAVHKESVTTVGENTGSASVAMMICEKLSSKDVVYHGVVSIKANKISGSGDNSRVVDTSLILGKKRTAVVETANAKCIVRDPSSEIQSYSYNCSTTNNLSVSRSFEAIDTNFDEALQIPYSASASGDGSPVVPENLSCAAASISSSSSSNDVQCRSDPVIAAVSKDGVHVCAQATNEHILLMPVKGETSFDSFSDVYSEYPVAYCTSTEISQQLHAMKKMDVFNCGVEFSELSVSCESHGETNCVPLTINKDFTRASTNLNLVWNAQVPGQEFSAFLHGMDSTELVNKRKILSKIQEPSTIRTSSGSKEKCSEKPCVGLPEEILQQVNCLGNRIVGQIILGDGENEQSVPASRDILTRGNDYNALLTIVKHEQDVSTLNTPSLEYPGCPSYVAMPMDTASVFSSLSLAIPSNAPFGLVAMPANTGSVYTTPSLAMSPKTELELVLEPSITMSTSSESAIFRTPSITEPATTNASHVCTPSALSQLDACVRNIKDSPSITEADHIITNVLSPLPYLTPTARSIDSSDCSFHSANDSQQMSASLCVTVDKWSDIISPNSSIGNCYKTSTLDVNGNEIPVIGTNDNLAVQMGLSDQMSEDSQVADKVTLIGSAQRKLPAELLAMKDVGIDIYSLELAGPVPDVGRVTNADLQDGVLRNDFEYVQLALEHHKDLDIEQLDADGTTLLMLAANAGFDRMTERLKLRGADVNARRTDGTTALMIAAEQGYQKTVEHLLSPVMRARLNDMNRCGETALIKATKNGYHRVMLDLLNEGANFSPTLPHFPSAKSIARMAKDQTALKLLNRHARQ